MCCVIFSTMKKVLLVTNYFRPEPGGLEALFTGVARNWQKGQIEVISTKTIKHNLTNIAQRNLFDQKENYIIKRPEIRTGVWQFWKANEKLRNYFEDCIADFKPDHILFGDLHHAACIAAQVAEKSGITWSVFLNGNDFKNRLGVFQLKERKTALQARNVFTLSRYLARGAHGFGIPEDKITVIPPAFESRWTKKRFASLPEFLKKRIGKKLMILAMGPLLPRKGLDILIKSYARLKEHHAQTHLLVAGSGPEFSFLNELVRLHGLEDHVTIAGFLEDSTVASVWKRADLFVQPGNEREDDVESLGAVFLEAAYFGVPVIAGRLGGIDEIVRHGVSGFIIEPGNVKEFSEKLKQLIVSDRLRIRFGKNASDIARRDFDLKRVCSFIDLRLV